MTPQENLTSEEKLMAMLSHLSIVFGGIVLPIIFWATQKEKSKYITFHALQAIFFQLTYIVIVVFVVCILVFVSIFLGLGLGVMTAGTTSDSPGFAAIFIVFIIAAYALILLSVAAAIGYGVYLAIRSYNGAYVKVPIIGKIVYKKVYGAV